jgi:hypothetical protein
MSGKQKLVFNPFTSNFDYVEESLSKAEIAKLFLLDSNQAIPYPVASFIFDEDSVLYNDDEEL